MLCLFGLEWKSQQDSKDMGISSACGWTQHRQRILQPNDDCTNNKFIDFGVDLFDGSADWVASWISLLRRRRRRRVGSEETLQGNAAITAVVI